MLNSKFVTVSELADRALSYQAKGLKVVLCHGTFDLLHIGHIRHIQEAKQYGEKLFVTVTADEFVNKGPGRPVFSDKLRAEHIAALEYVDGVAVNNESTSVNIIRSIKPNVYVKGKDYRANEQDITGNIILEKEAVEQCGGKIVYTDDITFSSSKLLNDHFDVFSPETKEYLNQIKMEYTSNDVIEMLKRVNKQNILVIGDAIIDEYHYTSPLGQTGKYNVLSVKYDSQERFAGGSIAVANHVAGFVENVTLFTGLGSVRSHEDFICSKLKDNIKPNFLYYEDAPTLVKRRYVDGEMLKLFEVYYYEDTPSQSNINDQACEWLSQHISDYDAVIVPDFGNGFISKDMVEIISEKSKFLSVNTQLNSGNRGYHAITRYPRANFISLNEPEIRLAAHSRHGELDVVAEFIAQKLTARYIAVTRGTNGVMMRDSVQAEPYKAPALSTNVVDRIGAGDAFLSLAGVCLSGGLPPKIATFIASAAAALDVAIVCNRETVDPVELSKYITTLLK